MKIPLVLKPGSAEPWTPFRIIQALIKAGAPREAFSFYPPITVAREKSFESAAAHMVFGDVQRRGCGKAIRASRYTGPATARSSSAKTADQWEHIST